MNAKLSTLAAFTLLATTTTAVSRAGEWDLTGFAGIESRSFRQAGSFDGQESQSASSVVAQSEFYWTGSRDGMRFAAVAYGRADSVDGERSHVDLRETKLGFSGDGWDINAGIDKVFWGVTESRHLVDVINQTDLVEDIDEEDKLGQPMINLGFGRSFGRFELFLMPRFRERSFPGGDGRLRGPVPVAGDAARYESRDGKRHTDVSFRYSHYFGDFDLGVHTFDGTSREPVFELAADGSHLIPVYEQMQQAGIDLQWTKDALLFKLEAMARETTRDSFAAAVTGIEYTLFGVRGGNTDVGILFEYLYDDRSAEAPPTPFDDDVFVGTRLALNDAGDTSVLAGAVTDLESRETFLNVEATRRFGEKFTLDARLRIFADARPGDATYWLDRDDYLELSLSWFY